MPSFIALAPLGLERLVAREIRGLGGGVGRTLPEPGRVAFEGPPDALYRANLQLRVAERVLVRLGEGKARTFDELRTLVSDIQWESFVSSKLPLRVAASARACRLYHTDALAERVREALATRGIDAPEPAEEYRGAVQTIDLRGTEDNWIVSVDSSGGALNRRGYRQQTAKAPIRENLAAGLLLAAGWDGSVPLLDPMCGSGTIVLEAAWIAAHRPPGLDRPFLFERFADFDAPRWTALKEEARAGLRPGPFDIEGADRAGGAIKAAQGNARRAGSTEGLALVRRSIEDTPLREGPGMVLFNPPFGRRIGPEEDPTDAWKAWGELLRARRPGWRLLALAPRRELAEAFGAPGKPWLRFRHGGLDVALVEVGRG